MLTKLAVMALATLSGVVAHRSGHDEAGRYIPGGHQHLASAATWSYDRTDHIIGPSRWGDLTPQCNGNHQSPIDIDSSTYDATLRPLAFSYSHGWVNRTEVNTGHSIQVNEDASVSSNKLSGGALTGTYSAIQFHFHTTSEHTVQGANYPVELHIVHLNDDVGHQGATDAAQLAVVGLNFREGPSGTPDHPGLAPFIDALESVTVQDQTTRVNIDLNALLPTERDYWTYPGSLTTPSGTVAAPGCRETVTWHVLKSVQTISGEQYWKLREIMHNELTNRPVQPLNDRVIRTNSRDGWDATATTGGSAAGVVINFANMFTGLKVGGQA